MHFRLRSCIKYVWFDRSCMFNTFLNENILRIIRIKCVICIILNTRINRLLSKCNDRNKNQNDLFHSENWPITPENWPISALFWS